MRETFYPCLSQASTDMVLRAGAAVHEERRCQYAEESGKTEAEPLTTWANPQTRGQETCVAKGRIVNILGFVVTHSPYCVIFFFFSSNNAACFLGCTKTDCGWICLADQSLMTFPLNEPSNHLSPGFLLRNII